MDIADILKDLMSPRSALTDTATSKTPTSRGSGNGFGRMGSSGKGTRIGVRLPERVVEDYEEEDSTIVHLLPTETEETEEYYYDDDEDDSVRVKEKDRDDDGIFIFQSPSGIENIDNQKHHHNHQDTTIKLKKFGEQLHHSPHQNHTNTPGPAAMTLTNLRQQQHSEQARYHQPQIIPSLLSCSEDDTEDEDIVEEESTIVQHLPGEDDADTSTAHHTPNITFQNQWQQQLQRSSSNCSSSQSLPFQEVFVKNKTKKESDDNENNKSIKGGRGVEIVDVISEHFAFSPQWEGVGVASEGGPDASGGVGVDAAAGDKNVAVDDESTVIQLLPGEVYDCNNDDVSDIAFADERMHRSKDGQKGMQHSPYSVKKKAATAAAIFVTLTVCLGVGYKAGNVMTSKSSSSSSSSSSVDFTALTPEDCLALRNATTSHEDAGKQLRKHRRQKGQETFLRRSLEKNDWKKIFTQCDEILGPQPQTQDDLSNNSTSESSSYQELQSETQDTNNATKYTIFRGKAKKQGKSSKTVKPKQQLNTVKEQKGQQRGSKSIKSPSSTKIMSPSSPVNDDANLTAPDSATPTTEEQPSLPSNTKGESSSALTISATEHCPSVGQSCKGPKDCCQGEKCCKGICRSSLLGDKDSPCL